MEGQSLEGDEEEEVIGYVVDSPVLGCDLPCVQVIITHCTCLVMLRRTVATCAHYNRLSCRQCVYLR